ncbi:MAG: hypothetical protein QNK16_11785 [Woeseiaceae bacterium]|nr:hypothetical protein [Woeseiaceae bacterium]MDX2609058.1 hypothetical protein [Woeseiaceae bacterium]
MLRSCWTTATIVLFLPIFAASAQDNNVPDPLFASDEIIDVEIEAPFGFLTSERPNDEEVAGKFRYTADDGSLVEFEVAVRTRGRLRRTKEVCQFPPLRLNFKKSEVKGSLFDKQDRLKVVTHCRKQTRYEQAVVSEYLAYRIFNLLSDASYRVRLLRATYTYNDEERQVQSYAILIEHKDRIGNRLNAKAVQIDDPDTKEIESAMVQDLRRPDSNLASVFQYLIGNTDFSAVKAAPGEDCCHNQTIFALEGEPNYTVPYDFDQSGLVNAPHALPNVRFALRSTRERLYRGRCVNNGYLPATLRLFNDKRDDIEALVRNQQDLTKGAARRMLVFIKQFYDTINKPRRLDREIVKRCI